jgi:hypothetical protein
MQGELDHGSLDAESVDVSPDQSGSDGAASSDDHGSGGADSSSDHSGSADSSSDGSGSSS